MAAKTYFCRTCGAEERGPHVPANWYSLARYAPDINPRNGKRRVVGMGLFCQLKCITEMLHRLGENGETR